MQARPVKMRSWIGLAAGRDIAVADDALRVQGRESLEQGIANAAQYLVLYKLIQTIIAAFQFDADGEIVAAFATLETGFPGMPGAAIEGNILHHFAVAADQYMRRYLQFGDFLKIRMSGGIKGIAKQGIDPRSAEFARWQADTVDYQQLDGTFSRPLVAVGRR